MLDVMAMAVKTARVLLGTYAAGGPRFMSEHDVARIHTRPDEHFRRLQLGLEGEGITGSLTPDHRPPEPVRLGVLFRFVCQISRITLQFFIRSYNPPPTQGLCMLVLPDHQPISPTIAALKRHAQDGFRSSGPRSGAAIYTRSTGRLKASPPCCKGPWRWRPFWPKKSGRQSRRDLFAGHIQFFDYSYPLYARRLEPVSARAENIKGRRQPEQASVQISAHRR